MRKLVVFLFISSFFAFAKTEIGTLKGVPFRIDVPDNWNRNLVVYYHGLGLEPHTYKQEDLGPVLAEFTKRGYAVIQSGFSKPGWAVEQAVPETEALRLYFVHKYGAPKETFVTGHSMGGFLTAETIERFPEKYVGGLALCGALEPAPDLLKRAFDFEVIIGYYFPGLFPTPDKIPADFKGNQPVSQQLDAHPENAAALRQIGKLKNNKELASVAVFLNLILKDIQERSGGNPFSNRNTIYNGSPDDNALNDGVKRYNASASLNYLKANYTLTGKLQKPVLAIHTSYDPLVSVDVPDHYAFMTAVSGNGNMFVQQYVEHDGHCNIAPEEVGKGFDELLAWTHQHIKPEGGHLTVAPAKK